MKTCKKNTACFYHDCNCWNWNGTVHKLNRGTQAAKLLGDTRNGLAINETHSYQSLAQVTLTN